MARLAMRNGVRIGAVSVCTLAVAGLLAAVVQQSWRATAATAEVVRLEQRGAEILHPLTTLLAELVEAQSTAVRGESVDMETVRGALAGVAEVDAQHGVALKTRQRLADLTARVESAFGRAETGRAAYDTYTGIVTLTVDLVRLVGDNSHLIHDPDLDSYYLMEAAIIQLPDSMVFAGRAADLVALAGGESLVGEDEVRAAVARFGVSSAAEKVNAGLTQSVDFTARSELGTNIAERLDAFRAAADSFAPPTMLAELSTSVPAATLAANARRVYAAANPLAHRLLGELQELLDDRAAKLAGERRLTAVAAALIAVLGIVMICLLTFARGPRWYAARGPGGPTARGQVDGRTVGTLSYARDVLASEGLEPAGLASAGRSAPARTRGNGDAG
jgi:hypothetical protein